MNRHRRTTRILWGSPLPPIRSGVSDYAWELLPELAKRARVRVLQPPRWQPESDWGEDLPLVHRDTRADSGEIELLHLGNNPHHLWLLPRLRSGGPVIVLHDAVLHHLLVEFSRSVAVQGILDRELWSAHGTQGGALMAARNAGYHGRIDPFLFPARRSFLRHASAVIVHSAWAADVVAREFPDTPVCQIPLAVADPSPIDRGAARAALGIDPEETVLMHLGFLSPEKGLESILAGVAAATHSGIPVRLVIAGEGPQTGELVEAAEGLGVGDRLTVTGWIETAVFPGIPAAADLGVVYRTPSAGETSAAVLRFFACGVPVAVGGRRQFLELPVEAAPRLTPGSSAAADLARLLGEIGADDWSQRGAVARAAYEAAHQPEQVAGRLLSVIEEWRDS